MSIFSIKQYLAEVEKIIHFGGTAKETAIRNAFYNLLNEYLKPKNLMLIAEKFNTYKFADYKDKVIDLLKRVCSVSVQTMTIINEMEKS